MPSFLPPLRSRFTAWRSSEPGRIWRFYGGCFRWPLLLLLGALAADKTLYYIILPLTGYLTGKTDYLAARIEFARDRNQAALDHIRQALLHTRSDPAFWELAARIAGRLDSSEATYCWQQLDQLRPGVFPTQIRVAESALRYQQLDAALAVLREVGAADQEKIPFLRASGELAQACGEKRRARDYFARVEASHPADAETLCALARWEADSDDPAEQARSRAQLAPLLARPESRAEAWRLLIRLALKTGDLAGAKKWSDDLLGSHGASFTDRVQRLDLLRGPAFRAELDGLMAVADAPEIVPVAAWLTAHGRAEEALIWIRRQTQETQDDPLVGRARAECLSALGLWEHLRDIQAADLWPAHEHERLMYLTRAWLELGSESDARASWLHAVVACRSYPDYLVLLDYIARNKFSPFWTDARTQLWLRMIGQYPGQGWLARALLQDGIDRRDTVRIEYCRAQLVAIDPNNAGEEAAYALVCLLRGSRVEKASDAAARLLRENRSNPLVATAAAFDLYRQGKFGEALAVMGELAPEDLNAPERAVYLGAMLAAAGPVEQARNHLQVALARPELLEEERALAIRSQQLLAYREAMGSLLHPETQPIFAPAASPENPPEIFHIGESVAFSRAGDAEKAARSLADINLVRLDAAGLSLYLGAVLDLAGEHREARPRLELSPDLPFESETEKCRRAVELWWTMEARAPDDAAVLAGLFSAYRGLEAHEDDPAFWARDEPRELRAVRGALLSGVEIGAAQERLHGLLKRVPFNAALQAQLSYALLLQGQAFAARQRMEVLAPADLAQPETSLFYGLILDACGEKRAAKPYLRRAAGAGLMPEELALAERAEKAP